MSKEVAFSCEWSVGCESCGDSHQGTHANIVVKDDSVEIYTDGVSDGVSGFGLYLTRETAEKLCSIIQAKKQ